ncbi:hypothetical protein BV898_03957 [Hypsibius exemplaris]|uniref:Cytochrome b5 heme-binding domain-containing protein n=1 Tax=Hypsibius exemplaris TaxID=2072580 RepID=A0A1W0X489_HYPEX|nr:hypothetical protein BV898_03957 [Hypsibius exemplaris]
MSAPGGSSEHEALTRYTWEEVRTHSTVASLWIVLRDPGAPSATLPRTPPRTLVYDVTDFHDSHPGGTDILLTHAGKDATLAFEDVEHSRYALIKLKEFLIGEITERPVGKAKS